MDFMSEPDHMKHYNIKFMDHFITISKHLLINCLININYYLLIDIISINTTSLIGSTYLNAKIILKQNKGLTEQNV